MNSLKLVLFSVFFVISSALFAQFDLGIKVGANYNYAGFSSDSLNLSFDNATSLSGGGFMRVTAKRISLQAEGLFISRKGTVSGSGSPKNVDFVSFDLPLMVGYKLINTKPFSLRLNAGVIPTFFLDSSGDLKNANYKDSFYSAAASISVDIPLFLIDFRYQGAIGDYYQFQQTTSTSTISSNLLTLSFAWKIL